MTEIIDPGLFKTEKEAAEYVCECEKRFEESASCVISKIRENNELRIITLSGPSCSGKTTTALKLCNEIEAAGKRARVLSIDDFYRDSIRHEKEPDFESASALDLALFRECTSLILSGKKAYIPIYDLSRGVRAGQVEYIPQKNDIYIFEGIQALYPEITECLEKFGYTSVFINAARGVKIGNTVFDKNEIRLIRRLVRDSKFRNASAEFTFELWDGVRANEEKNIYPNAERADFKIDSFLPYEVFIMRDIVLSLLDTVPAESAYSEKAALLSHKVRDIPKCPFSASMVPRGSVFREFIG